MPSAVASICRHHGCGKRAQGRFCPAHANSASQLDLARRGSASSRGYGRNHEKWRLLILGRDPTCQMEAWIRCLPLNVRPFGKTLTPCGGMRLSTVAHHKVPLRAGGARFDMDNGLGVCKACHDWWTRSQEPLFYPL